MIENRNIPPIEVSDNIENTCEGVTTGSIRLSVSNPVTGGYTFTWDDGRNGNELRDLGSGTYCVTVTNDEGCGDGFSKCYSVGINQRPVIDLANLQHCRSRTSCDNAFIELVQTATNYTNLQYSWDGFSSVSNDVFTTVTDNPRLDDLPFPGRYRVTAVNHDNYCNGFAFEVDILSGCDEAPEIPDASAGNFYTIIPQSSGFPYGAFILSEEVSRSLGFRWEGPNGFEYQGHSVPSWIEKPLGEYTLIITNGCSEKEFAFELESCSTNFKVEVVEYCNACVREGYGFIRFRITEGFDPLKKYYNLEPNGPVEIPVQEGGTFFTTRYLQDQSGTVPFIFFSDDLCASSVELYMEVDYNTYVEQVPYIDFTNNLDGTFTPITCNVATYCRARGGLSGRCRESFVGIRDVRVISPVQINSSVRGASCIGTVGCGGDVINLSGFSEELTTFNGRDCVEGTICQLRGSTFAPVYRELRREPNLPLEVSLNVPQEIDRKFDPELYQS